jgi:hypothetical protein
MLLEPSALVRTHVNVYECPAELSGNLSAEPIHFVVMSLDSNDIGSVNQRVQNLALLEVRGMNT